MRRLDIDNLQALNDVSSRYENPLSDVKGASYIFVTISVPYRNIRHARRMAQKQFLSFARVHDFTPRYEPHLIGNARSPPSRPKIVTERVAG